MKTPLETTIGIISSKRSSDLQTKLKRSFLEGALPNIVRGTSLHALIDNKDIRIEDVPPFLDPIKVDNNWVIDLRPLKSKVLVNNSNYSIPDDGPIGLLKRTTFASMHWEADPSSFDSLGNFGIICFGFWIGNLLSNTEGLQITDRNRLIVAAMYWAWSQKNIIDRKATDELTADEENTATSVISGNVGIERSEILSIIRTMGRLTDIFSFVSAIKLLGINRLRNIDSGTLITLVGNSWFGFIDTKHMLAVALEYPPYFYAIVYEALENNRLYKKTNIAGVVENQRNNHTLRSFKANFKELMAALDE